MEHVRDLEQLSLERCDLTIGSFDGVHRGHQSLLKRMVDHAHRQGQPSVVLTFYPHPSVVLRGRQPAFYISTPEEKAALLADLSVDYVVTQPFDRETSLISADTFLDMLQKHLGLRDLWIGEDFALGHQRKGNRFFLQKAGEARGFRLHVVPPLMVEGDVISSTRVREALRSGDVSRVERYLGRPFRLPGKVVKGAGRGEGLGIPTANIEIWEERAFPRCGVYACWAEMNGGRWMAVTNIGVRPTFEDGQSSPTLEAHLLDFAGDLYGDTLTLTFIARLRDERRFDDVQALLAQIDRDIARARKILKRRREKDDG